MIKDTGGPAFASGAVRKVRARPGDFGSDWVTNDISDSVYLGMHLRDYFAAKALQGMLANSNTTGLDALGVVEASWAFADKMIELRDKP